MTPSFSVTPKVPLPSSAWRWAVVGLLVVLWLLRVPSLAQPMAADQSLYAYAGQRLAEGQAPYQAAWDQKPPGVHVIYAALWSVWPHESVVAGADMAVAGLIALLLVLIGQRRFTEGIGLGAAAVFLLFGNPSLVQRMSGVFVRAQSETFIALAITMAVALVAAERRRRWHLAGAGLLLGCAFWLKYNAAAYAIVVGVALVIWRGNERSSWRSVWPELRWVAVAGGLAVAIPLAVMGAAGVLQDLYLATISYNLAYSGETFQGQHPLVYLLTFPINHARNDGLWLLGGVGALMAGFRWLRGPRDASSLAGIVALCWVGAACLSIVINGARELPQYFVQAAPALALIATVGLAPILRTWRTRALVPAIVVIALGVALLQPGEWGHFPKLMDNTLADWSALVGRTERQTYLTRFGGRPQDKWVASEVDALAASIAATTSPSEPIYVFGFSPGVFVKSDRRSASRFHWSRPVVIEFAAGTPGYGSGALLSDLTREAPSVVALQKQDWGSAPEELAVENSVAFFHGHADLDGWLKAHYTMERETALYEIWRRQ